MPVFKTGAFNRSATPPGWNASLTVPLVSAVTTRRPARSPLQSARPRPA